jgi:hypothetical protein
MAVVLAAAGLPRDKSPNKVGLTRLAAVLELLTKSVGQVTFIGLKTVVETINEKLGRNRG